jgi:CheY-like chemotaxis protein
MVRVFLAEDNPGDVNLVREALAAHRIENVLTVAANGNEAMQAVSEICAEENNDRPDVVLLDVNLPFIDGLTVLAALREDPGCATLPVIIVTSSDNARVALFQETDRFR